MYIYIYIFFFYQDAYLILIEAIPAFSFCSSTFLKTVKKLISVVFIFQLMRKREKFKMSMFLLVYEKKNLKRIKRLFKAGVLYMYIFSVFPLTLSELFKVQK